MTNSNEHPIGLLNDLILRYPQLESCKEDILKSFNVLKNCYYNKHKILVCGNGGSASDSEHIVGELMKGFKNPRALSREEQEKLISIDNERGKGLSEKLQKPLPAISLVGHPALSTAFLNDVSNGAEMGFAQATYGLGEEGDVLLGISTSGNSSNVIYAAVAAKAKGMSVIALTGKSNNELSKFADVNIRAPETETFKIQEYHLPIYHCLCLMLEEEFFGHRE